MAFQLARKRLFGRRLSKSSSNALKLLENRSHSFSSQTMHSADIKLVSETLQIISLVRSFRDRGHYIANLDPLGRTLGPLISSNDDINHKEPKNAVDLYKLLGNYPELNLDAVGLRGINPEKKYYLGSHVRIIKAARLFWSVSDLVSLLRESYCGTLTVEKSHLTSLVEQEWVQEAMERPPNARRSLLSAKEKKETMYRLLYAEEFERFLSKEFPSSKRFGLEGCECLIPGLWSIIVNASRGGVSQIELGMSHRGRLNVLHSVLGKSMSSIVSGFKPSKAGEGESSYSFGYSHGFAGDVQYHLGTHGSLTLGDKKLSISLSPNPSHLEAVDPVVLGTARAKQFFLGDRSRTRVMPLLLHGDAAFSGLGMTAEILQLSSLPEYTTGGTIHIIINNQIGFTTDPKLARSSVHPSDVAKAVGAPIFHVNGDDPEAVVHACTLAVNWRQRFHRDVVVDIVCYRRHGHNEQDDPSVTQPLAYAKIASHPTTAEIYSKKLINEGIFTVDDLEMWRSEIKLKFEQDSSLAAEFKPSPQEWLARNWQGEALGSQSLGRGTQPTGVHLRTLEKLGESLCQVPPNFNLHPRVRSLVTNREQMMATQEGIDWSMAEALAFGSIMVPFDPSLDQTEEKYPKFPVRLSGQDCERGTFNQRHSVWFDQTNSRRYVPLSNLSPYQSPFMVCNSNLSEAAVLGFEFGFSLANENALVMWEAQFGDFANNAQCIIDTFLASSEDKWMTASSLTLLLPHGYDGMGPEHSSARLERFLQLCGDDCDSLPWQQQSLKLDIEAGFKAADRGSKGYVTVGDLRKHMSVNGSVHMDVEWIMRGFGDGQKLHRDGWQLFMTAWMRRNAEKDHNLFVVNATTPANYFHVLRRQVSRPYSKPLVVMTPKYLLHHSACVSKLTDMAQGTFFRRVICDGDEGDNVPQLVPDLVPSSQVSRLIVCSGKVFYLLAHARKAKRVRDIVLVRLEQIAPMAMDRLASIVNKYENAELVWVQEEPKNMGAWTYVKPRLETMVRELCPARKDAEVRYVGRAASASTATGNLAVHLRESKEIIELAFAR